MGWRLPFSAKVRKKERQRLLIEIGELGEFDRVDSAFARFGLRHVGLMAMKGRSSLSLRQTSLHARLAQSSE
jgi:hypothetical protein